MKQSPPWSLAGKVDVRLLVSCFPVDEHQLLCWCCFIVHLSFPRVLCQPAVFAGTALPFAPLIFILLPLPCSEICSYLKPSFAGLMAPHEQPCPRCRDRPGPGALSPGTPVGFVGVPPFAEVTLAVCQSAPYGKRGLS